ncbi:hypothetical protein KI387_017684, partial [Taxus chinensis]
EEIEGAEEANSEETESLDAYIGDKDEDKPEGGQDHLVYYIHDSKDEEGEEKYNKEDEEETNKKEAYDQKNGVSEE